MQSLMVNKQNQRSMPLIHFNNKGRDIHTYAPNNSNEPFFSVFADWLIFCSTETAKQKLKYATSEGSFSTFHGKKKSCSICTKKLHNISFENYEIYFDFLGSK